MTDGSRKQQVDTPKQKWTHTLNGRWGVQTYGVVEFLGVHPFYRLVTGAIGVAFCIACVVGFIFNSTNTKIFGVPPMGLFVSSIFVGPWLIYVTTISGKHWAVIFPVMQAKEETEKAEREFNKSKTVENALNFDLTKLNEYYVINQSQARSSFGWAVFSMLLGFSTIIAGVWLFYFRGGQPDTFMASLSIAAGCVVNIISVLFINLHSKVQARALHHFDQLSRLQNLSIAIQLIDSCEEPTERQNARNLVIRGLMTNAVLSQRAADK
jgi:hypothetical protein